MDDNCINHTFDLAHARCRACGYPYCTGCLVYPFGAGKPPLCVKCAIVAGGVRSNAAPAPVRSQKATRDLHKAQAKAAKAEARASGGRRWRRTPAGEGLVAGTGSGVDGAPGVLPAPAHDPGVHHILHRSAAPEER